MNLSTKLSEIKMFPNSGMCYVSPDGDSSATYEPIPYATTQLIQANIKNKAAAAGAKAEPLDIPCWKQQPPNLPPLPKEMTAQMQYNITEQNMLIKGKLWFDLERFKKIKKKNNRLFVSADNLQGSEGAIHPKPVPYNHSREYNTGGSCQSSDRGSNSTAGNSSRESSLALEQIHLVNDGPDVLSSFIRESKSKEGSSGPQNPQT